MNHEGIQGNVYPCETNLFDCTAAGAVKNKSQNGVNGQKKFWGLTPINDR
jgi:hypothetical protein